MAQCCSSALYPQLYIPNTLFLLVALVCGHFSGTAYCFSEGDIEEVSNVAVCKSSLLADCGGEGCVSASFFKNGAIGGLENRKIATQTVHDSRVRWLLVIALGQQVFTHL
jgi:hypothetical protein